MRPIWSTFILGLILTAIIVLYSIRWRQDVSSPAERPFIHKSTNGEKLDVNIWPELNDNYYDRTIKQIQSFERKDHATVRKSKSFLIVGTYLGDIEEAQRVFNDNRCGISQCTVGLATDWREIPRTPADAIFILNMDASMLKHFLPKPAHQIWIASHWESPAHNRIDTVAMGSYVNWSASYRHDSHIVTPYGFVEPLPISSVDKSTTVVDYAAGKTKQVAWFASNCYDKNGRKNYAYELSRYINVDIYGKCGLGTLHCPTSNESLCFEWLEKDYKFYLAFENSNCHYYITEKAFVNALRHNVIPIVMGARRQDYAKALPPHSYIHVDDFRSPRDLADYLHVLDTNNTLYNEYFRWKTEYTLTAYSFLCKICGLLHVASEQRYVHWYTDYSQWWDGDQGSACGSKWISFNNVSWRTWNV